MHFLDITNSSVGANASDMVCGGHPSWLGHAAAAAIAEPVIKAALHE